MVCTSVFEHPTKGIYRYSFGQRTVMGETDQARGFDGNQHFGRYLYSRVIRQERMRVGSRYQLKPTSNGAMLMYRQLDEDLFGQFDYCRAVGSHGDRMHLPVEVRVPVPGLNSHSTATLTLELVGTRTHRFMELCKTHVFEVRLIDGHAQLLGFKGESQQLPSVAIPLNRIH